MMINSRNSGHMHDKPSDITPQAVYLGRRRLIQTIAGGVASAGLASWASRDALAQTPRPGKLAA